ncbi:transposase [Ktedonobacter sp. SOSP1-85]|uniref:transposase n=1 Tax=Ktedonobacter sp. SOSP1-85 TaxID=2778367 RepID=UPI0027DBFD9F|nr:transposase [Ktedonobacter sp. SOSP1-85]
MHHRKRLYQQGQLNILLQESTRAKTAYHLVETFLSMMCERTGEQLDAWLEAVQVSQLEAFVPFVTSIQHDKEAVLAGLTLPWNTGPLEGHINRLKLIKRSMYGRAKFDLLRLRVLSHPETKTITRTQNNERLRPAA